MNARDDLARIIMSPESFDGGPVSCGPNSVYAARTADAILAKYVVIPKALQDSINRIIETHAGAPRMSNNERSISQIIGECAGAVSVCWSEIGNAGVFDSSVAGGYVDAAVAEILANCIVIPKADLPKVTQSTNGDPNSYRTDGENVVFTSVENARMWTMRDIAVWQFIEAKEARAAEANAALTTRRDELADEFTAVRTYGGQLPYTQRLIDRIIELEGKAFR